MGDVDIVADYWQQPPGGGHQSIDLSGTQAGSLYQDVATMAGLTYHCSLRSRGQSRWGNRAEASHRVRGAHRKSDPDNGGLHLQHYRSESNEHGLGPKGVHVHRHQLAD